MRNACRLAAKYIEKDDKWLRDQAVEVGYYEDACFTLKFLFRTFAFFCARYVLEGNSEKATFVSPKN